MALLLDDLLDISRVTRGTLELRTEMTELAAVVDAAVETARPMIDAKRHSFAVELAGRARALRRGSSATCPGAFESPDERGEIHRSRRFHTATRVGSDDAVTITVADKGMGLAPDALSRVFAMFSQVKSTQDRSEGGLGIGLALSKGLVELHGGSIEARSAGAGRGSEFIVHPPAPTVTSGHAHSATRSRRESDPPSAAC